MNQELPDVQVGFRKDRGTRDQIVNICWIMEKAREFQKKKTTTTTTTKTTATTKTSISASVTTLKPLTV